MSSWQEYKKKKKQNIEYTMTTSNSNVKVDNSNMSSWQKFKQEKNSNNNSTQLSSWEKFKKDKEEKKLTTNTSSNTKQNNTIGEEVGNFAKGTGKVADNLWQGLKNGFMSFQQNLGRNMFNLEGRKRELEMFENIEQEILEKQTEGLNSKEKQAIYEKYENSRKEWENNPLSERYFINSVEEKNQKLQEKKNENTLKIQQNAESMNTEVGKYIAGEIAPRYRTNDTRYDWWSSWYNLFYWFCNRKLL